MKSEDLLMRACRQQFEFAAGMIQSLTEGSKKLQETNLKAASEASASFASAQKQIAQAADPSEIWRIQTGWASQNIEKAMAYWRDLTTIALGAQSAIAKRLAEDVQRIDPETTVIETPGNVVEMMERAYKQWLETTRRIAAASKEPAHPL